MKILDKLRAAAIDQLRDQLKAAMPQEFPGKLRLTCTGCPLGGPPTVVDDQLTGSDLVAVTEWLNTHSGHGERAISLTIPAGVETKVQTA